MDTAEVTTPSHSILQLPDLCYQPLTWLSTNHSSIKAAPRDAKSSTKLRRNFTSVYVFFFFLSFQSGMWTTLCASSNKKKLNLTLTSNQFSLLIFAFRVLWGISHHWDDLTCRMKFTYGDTSFSHTRTILQIDLLHGVTRVEYIPLIVEGLLSFNCPGL